MSQITDKFGRSFAVIATGGITAISGAITATLPGERDDAQVLAYVESMPPPGDHRTQDEIDAAARASMRPVSAAQIRLALLDMPAPEPYPHMLAAVNAMVEASGDEALKINWATRSVFERTHPLVVQMIASLGLTPAAGDQVFLLADSK